MSIALAMLLLPLMTRGQDLLQTADSLVSANQYNSAFKLLHNVPASDSDRDIVLKKVDIALNGFVQSIVHQIFAFKDLAPGETLDDYRGKEGKYEMYLFKIDSVLIHLIHVYPNDGRLYRSLADFYYDVFWKYGERWLLPKDSVVSLMQTNYLIASMKGIHDYNVFHNLGISYIQQHKFVEAIESLKKSLVINPEFASANYNLAYAFMSIDSLQGAARYAVAAYSLYDAEDLKGDAAHLAGLSYLGLKSDSLAIIYLSRADRLNPDNYYFMLHLLQAYLHAGEGGLADKTAVALFKLGPTNPRISSDLLESYSDSNLKASLPRLFIQFLKSYEQEPEVLGNICFHLSKYYGAGNDRKTALDYLEKARLNFQVCMPDTHYVFRVIDKERIQLQEQK